jgi:hypothetical protein
MVTSEDFTSLAAGTKVPIEGNVAPCPVCGKNAIEHRPTDRAPYWVHRQSTELLCDGLLVEFQEICSAVN